MNIKLAILVLSAGFCLSGQSPYKAKQEVEMTNTSPSEEPKSEVARPEQKPAVKIHGAAKKITQGAPLPDVTMNAPRKSAARRAMEAEGQ